jgi:hypothetical protein
MACFSSLSPSISLSFLCIWPPSPPGSAHTFVFGGLVKKVNGRARCTESQNVDDFKLPIYSYFQIFIPSFIEFFTAI